jgi:hypothetical protein
MPSSTASRMARYTASRTCHVVASSTVKKSAPVVHGEQSKTLQRHVARAFDAGELARPNPVSRSALWSLSIVMS